MHDTTYDTCVDILRAEYGDSRNFIAPNVIAHGGVVPKWAAEIAYGEGIEHGTFLVGVSVVLVTDEGTERCFELSRCFSGPNLDALRDEALTYMRGLDELVDDQLREEVA